MRGLNQSEVAVILGLKSTSMISRWENGACLPDTPNVLRLAVLYRTLVDGLFRDLMIRLKDDLAEREAKVTGEKER